MQRVSTEPLTADSWVFIATIQIGNDFGGTAAGGIPCEIRMLILQVGGFIE